MERVLQDSVSQNTDEQKYMMEIPHTSVFGLVMYSMVCKTTRFVRYSQAVASIDTKVIEVQIMGQQ